MPVNYNISGIKVELGSRVRVLTTVAAKGSRQIQQNYKASAEYKAFKAYMQDKPSKDKKHIKNSKEYKDLVEYKNSKIYSKDYEDTQGVLTGIVLDKVELKPDKEGCRSWYLVLKLTKPSGSFVSGQIVYLQETKIVALSIICE